MATNKTGKFRVALLLGGDSSEREVSFNSGKEMANALAADRYAVTVFDVALPATRATQGSLGSDALGHRPRHACLPVEWNQLTTTLYTSGFDVVLPALHGGWGEDGTLQSLLDVAGIPYTGSTARASVIAIDKQVCKAVVRDLGIPAPQGRLVTDVAEVDESFPITAPCVVKPNAGGSSVAITILRDTGQSAAAGHGQLRQAVAAALADGSAALVEEFVVGVEVTAGVLGEGDTARVLPLIEVVPQSAGGFYDYEAKYAPGGSQHLIPPRLPAAVLERVADYALRAHRAVGCRGVARSDFIVTPDGTPYFLELNTLPGMTSTSLVPDAARAAGLGFEALLETLIQQALER